MKTQKIKMESFISKDVYELDDKGNYIKYKSFEKTHYRTKRVYANNLLQDFIANLNPSSIIHIQYHSQDYIVLTYKSF